MEFNVQPDPGITRALGDPYLLSQAALGQHIFQWLFD